MLGSQATESPIKLSSKAAFEYLHAHPEATVNAVDCDLPLNSYLSSARPGGASAKRYIWVNFFAGYNSDNSQFTITHRTGPNEQTISFQFGAFVMTRSRNKSRGYIRFRLEYPELGWSSDMAVAQVKSRMLKSDIDGIATYEEGSRIKLNKISPLLNNINNKTITYDESMVNKTTDVRYKKRTRKEIDDVEEEYVEENDSDVEVKTNGNIIHAPEIPSPAKKLSRGQQLTQMTQEWGKIAQEKMDKIYKNDPIQATRRYKVTIEEVIVKEMVVSVSNVAASDNM
tara:strand:+ start:45891 stop:46742 length:852 start_codon:yes stop_codon:yes gene_type:complete